MTKLPWKIGISVAAKAELEKRCAQYVAERLANSKDLANDEGNCHGYFERSFFG